MAPSKIERQRIQENAEAAEGIARELVDLVESWDDADREEREGIAQEIESALNELAECGELARAQSAAMLS